MLFNFSDPPLEEDDLPTGEWICHRCRVMPPQPEVSVFGVDFESL
jgi:hypothetical protein